MPRARLVLIVLGTFLSAAPACAQGSARPPPPIKPFDPVGVKPPPARNDSGFAAFRQNLAAVARDRVYQELARLVVAHGFFWDRDLGGGFDPKRSGVDNLAAAIRLEHGSGAGWQMLADFAAEPTATETATAPGVLCAPGNPAFAQDDFDRLVDATHSSPAEWLYPRATGLDLRAAPRQASALVEKLGGYFVRVMRFETVPANADPLRTAWSRVAAPTGNVGFAAPGTLYSLASPQLCYLKDITGRWSIAGFIGSGN